MSDKPQAIAPKAQPSAAAGTVTSGAATYAQVGDDYLAQRRLQKSAGWVLLWALGVGAVISGDFFGWNYGLAAGGCGDARRAGGFCTT